MRERKRWMYYSLIIGLGFIIYFVFPPIFNSAVLTMGLLLFINPIYNIVSCMLYTVKFGMQVYLPVTLGILFLLSALLYYGLPYYVLLYFLHGCCLCGLRYGVSDSQAIFIRESGVCHSFYFNGRSMGKL